LQGLHRHGRSGQEGELDGWRHRWHLDGWVSYTPLSIAVDIENEACRTKVLSWSCTVQVCRARRRLCVAPFISVDSTSLPLSWKPFQSTCSRPSSLSLNLYSLPVLALVRQRRQFPRHRVLHRRMHDRLAQLRRPDPLERSCWKGCHVRHPPCLPTSILGHPCVSTRRAQNLKLTTYFLRSLPSSSSFSFSWSWFNKVGNREMYQNCFVRPFLYPMPLACPIGHRRT
jgi:hypothetical protein